MPGVVKIEKDEDFAVAMANAGPGKAIVVDFFATWCGPCTRIAPTFEEYSNKYPQALFLKVDVDKCKEVQRAYHVRSMPTFIFFRGTAKVDQMSGADPALLEQKIAALCAGDSAAAVPSAECGVPGMCVLSTESFMDKKRLEVLNAEDDDAISSLFKDDDTVFSADDEQMIVSLGFSQVVKIHSIRMHAPVDGRAPMEVSLFVNPKNSLDFDDAERAEPTQKLSLSREHAEGRPIELAFVNFQNVTTLTMFFENNQGDKEKTAIRCLEIIGSGRQTTDMSQFKRVSGEKGEGE